MTLLVRGGPANSGCKRPLREALREPWFCAECGQKNPRFASRCLTSGCNAARAS